LNSGTKPVVTTTSMLSSIRTVTTINSDQEHD